jgi:predicted PurR-regulated permease PerM
VGENLKLHPAVVILSVIWGGSFGGLLGIVVAPPLVASARIILHYVYGRLTERTAFAKRELAPETPIRRLQRLSDWISKMLRRSSRKAS